MSKLEVDAIEPQSGTTLTLGASGDAVNIASGATLTDFTSTGIDDNATSTAITIDSSERVGIGTASPISILHLYANDPQILLDDSGTQSSITNQSGNILYKTSAAARDHVFYGLSSEVARITGDGNLLVNKTALDNSVAGFSFATDNYLAVVRDGGQVFIANRLTDDGSLVSFRQNSTEEGTISVSGSTVSYNGFTGTHWSRFTDNSTPTILRGTILESLDEMCDWYNLEFDVITQDEEGNDITTPQKIPHVLTDTQSNGDVITYNHEGTDYQATIVKEADIKHMKSKVSDTVDAKNVYGVFVAYDEDGEGYNDFYVASVGSFVVRIKQGETVAKGDLLQSNGDGTAKVQSDDNVKSSSFAKVLSTTIIETYEDGSYLVPCSLMC